MKNLFLTSFFVFLICICQSQNKSNDYSKYIGKYHLKGADSVVVYDYIDIFEKNGKLYCSRESKFSYLEASTKKPKNTTNHFDCEIIYINLDKQKISFKFLDVIYNYKFRINSHTKKSEIIIVDSALVYEKR